MMNVRIFLSYDGTNYYGWQRQKGVITVQEVVEKSLSDILGESVCIVGSGRTDRGVHARMQVANFKIDSIPFTVEKLPRILSGRLPVDISCWKADLVDEGFHSIFSAKAKTYRYFFYFSDVRNPFIDRYAVRVEQIDYFVLKQCCQLFVGRHDFTAFCCNNNFDDFCRDTEREILNCNFKVLRRYRIGFIEVTGTGFLYKMVRRMVGIMLEVCRGRLSLEDIKQALKGHGADICWTTAQAKGLTLWRVYY